VDCLSVMFPWRVIPRFGDVAWPATSPELFAPHWFLYGHL
jgi:hypothetical protein